jgi:hypothetical protein
MKENDVSLQDSVLYRECFELHYQGLIASGIDPDADTEEDLNYEAVYEWNRMITEEPVMLALWNLTFMVRSWVSTEAQLLEELKQLTSTEVQEHGVFPSSPKELLQHMHDIKNYSDALHLVDFGFFDWRDYIEEDLEDWDVPAGWGPEAPLWVCHDSP